MPASRFSLGDELAAPTHDAWRSFVERELGEASFEGRLVTRTYDGVDLQPIYTARDAATRDPSGFPGAMPFVRGRAAVVPAPALEIAQERAEPGLEELSTFIADDLEHGVDWVHLRFDLASRIGLDGDDERADPLIGVGGACLYSMADLDLAFGGVRRDGVGVSLDAGASFLPAAAALVAWWDERAQPVSERRGAFNADPLGVLARDGALQMSLASAFDELAALVSWTAASGPHAPVGPSGRNVTALGVDTTAYHHAGATATLDLGLSLATAVEVLRQLEVRGVPPGDAAPQILFHYAIDTQLFQAIAKLRAARRLWARVLEVCAVDESKRGMSMRVSTSRRVMTARDPWVNMLRNTASGFAAVVGGANIVTSIPFDTALGLPNTIGRRVARNTPIVLCEEAHLDRVIDPAGGSWMIEHLTDALADKAWQVFQAVEREGGMAHALTTGSITQRIVTDRAPRLRNIATRRDGLIGVSEYPQLDEAPVERVVVDRGSLRDAVRKRLRVQRTRSDPKRALVDLDGVAREELVANLVAACRGGATIGQLVAALPRGEPITLAVPIVPHPDAEPYETLRDATDRAVDRGGTRPKVFLANLGSLAEHQTRSGFARAFFEAGGFAVVEGEGTVDADAVANAFRSSGARTVVLCSSDTLYPRWVESVTLALRREGARTVLLAGRPGDHETRYREVGVDQFIDGRSDVPATLQALLQAEGVVA